MNPFSGMRMPPPAGSYGEIEYLRQHVRELEAFLQKVKESPLPQAIVLEVKKKKTTLLRDGIRYEVNTPPFEVKPTDFVRVHSESHGIVELVDEPDVSGPMTTIAGVIDARHVEIDGLLGQGNRIVLFHGKEPRTGDRVIVDQTGSIVLKNLGPKNSGKPPVETGVDWDDIGGQVEAKRLLRSAIEGPVVDRELRRAYGKKRSRGALLAGPAGTGKTMLGKACATALARLYGKATTSTGFQYVKGPEMLASLLGQSEGNIRALFSNARTHEKEHGYPGVIFFDEGEAVLSRRDAARFNNVEKTIVPTFLAETDGLDDSAVFVIVASNRPDMLDPAVTREGRCDLKIYVGRPDRRDAEDILAKHFRGRPLDGMTPAEACAEAAEQVFHGRHALYMVRMKDAKKDRRFTLGDLASGAMLSGLVERATDLAIDRDRAAERKDAGGIRKQDLAKAADALCAEQKMLDHGADLEMFVDTFRAEVRTIDKVP